MPKLRSGFPTWQGLEATSLRTLASVKSPTFRYQGLCLGQNFCWNASPPLQSWFYSPGFDFPFHAPEDFFFLSFMPEFYKILFLYFHSIQPFYESVVPYCQKQRQLWNTDVQTQHKLEVGFNVVLLLPLQSQRENLAHTLRPKCSKSEGPDLDT